jgi:replication initiation and membrane attachment protein DnaB
MRITEKEHKKLRKIINNKTTTTTKKYVQKKEESLPAWFDKELQNNESTLQEQDEMEKLLKEIS